MLPNTYPRARIPAGNPPQKQPEVDPFNIFLQSLAQTNQLNSQQAPERLRLQRDMAFGRHLGAGGGEITADNPHGYAGGDPWNSGYFKPASERAGAQTAGPQMWGENPMALQHSMTQPTPQPAALPQNNYLASAFQPPQGANVMNTPYGMAYSTTGQSNLEAATPMAAPSMEPQQVPQPNPGMAFQPPILPQIPGQPNNIPTNLPQPTQLASQRSRAFQSPSLPQIPGQLNNIPPNLPQPTQLAAQRPMPRLAQAFQ